MNLNQSEGCFWLFIVARGLGKMELNTKFYVVVYAVHNFLSLFSLYLIFVFFFMVIAIMTIILC